MHLSVHKDAASGFVGRFVREIPAMMMMMEMIRRNVQKTFARMETHTHTYTLARAVVNSWLGSRNNAVAKPLPLKCKCTANGCPMDFAYGSSAAAV